jgi:hypothetical protein
MIFLVRNAPAKVSPTTIVFFICSLEICISDKKLLGMPYCLLIILLIDYFSILSFKKHAFAGIVPI